VARFDGSEAAKRVEGKMGDDPVGDGLGVGGGWQGSGLMGFHDGIHMEDWSSSPTPYLNSIKTAASMTSAIVGTASTAAGPYGAAVSAGVNMVIGSISDGIDAYDSQKTVAALKALMSEVRKLSNPAKDDLAFVLEIAIKKKTRHRDIAIGQASTLQLGKIGVGFYRMGRAIHKKRTGTKGVSRETAADNLIRYMKDSGPAGKVAKQIVIALSKQNFDDLLKNSIKESLRS
jgi:hypothetical protein